MTLGFVVIQWFMVLLVLMLMLSPLSLSVQNVQSFQHVFVVRPLAQTRRTTIDYRFRSSTRSVPLQIDRPRVAVLLHSSNDNNNNISKVLDLVQTSKKLIKEIEPYVEKEVLANQAQTQNENEEKEIETSSNSTVQKPNNRKDDAIVENTAEEGRMGHKKNDKQENNNNNNKQKKKTNNNPVVNEIEAIDRVFQRHRKQFQLRAQKTRLFFLRTLATWAYDTCSSTNQNGKIDASALYAGCLLVHLHLSKYVGVAACLPPTREQVDELFYLADEDKSGHLDKEEFTNAIVVACTPIAARVLIYWSLLAILPSVVTYTMTHVVDFVRSTFIRYWHRVFKFIIPLIRPNHIPHTPKIYSSLSNVSKIILAVMEWTVRHFLSILFFSIILPYLFSRIDTNYHNTARERYREQQQSTLWYLVGYNRRDGVDDNLNSSSSSSSSSSNKQAKRARGYFHRVGNAWYALQDSMFGSTTTYYYNMRRRGRRTSNNNNSTTSSNSRSSSSSSSPKEVLLPSKSDDKKDK